MLISAHKLLINFGSDNKAITRFQLNDNSFKIIHRLMYAFDKKSRTYFPSDKYRAVSFEIDRHLFLIKIIKEIERSYKNNALSVELIAKNIAVSERQIYRIFKDYLDITPSIFIKTYRLEKALKRIKRGDSLGNIAYSIGFSSHSYFSHCFKSRFGKTPTDFVKSLHYKKRQEINNAWQYIDNKMDS